MGTMPLAANPLADLTATSCPVATGAVWAIAGVAATSGLRPAPTKRIAIIVLPTYEKTSTAKRKLSALGALENLVEQAAVVEVRCLGTRPTAEVAVNRKHLELRKILGIFRRSEEHTSELQSLMRTSYAVFC